MHPIAALQSGWSLWTRDLEQEVGVRLTDEDLPRLGGIAPSGAAVGDRYADASYAYGDSPEQG